MKIWTMLRKLAFIYYDFLGLRLDALVESSQEKRHVVVEITWTEWKPRVECINSGFVTNLFPSLGNAIYPFCTLVTLTLKGKNFVVTSKIYLGPGNNSLPQRLVALTSVKTTTLGARSSHAQTCISFCYSE